MYKILASTLFLGKELIYMPTCHSTNDIAQELVSKYDKSEGIIVITDEQTKGRGQRGNAWLSNKGENLTFSIVLKPTFLKASRQFYLNMISSLAVADALNMIMEKDSALVKWPNDILINRMKLCGILIENTISGSRINNSIVGIGLNVNQQSFQTDNATSLRNVEESQWAISAVLEKVVLCLEGYYLLLKTGNYALIKEKYCQQLYGFDYPVKLFSEHEFFGQITDISEEGRLTVVEDRVKHVFDFKEVSFVLS